MGGVWLEAKGKMVLCIPVTDPPMMVVQLALELCIGPGLPHVVLVDCCQHHHPGSDSSSNSPNVCKDWEDECSAVDHHPYRHNSWLAVARNHGHCPDRQHCACCGWRTCIVAEQGCSQLGGCWPTFMQSWMFAS